MRILRGILFCLLAACSLPAAPAAAPQRGEQDPYETGKQLFDELAPPEVKALYDFPSREQFDEFMNQLQRALDSGNLAALAQYEPQVKLALGFLRSEPKYADYANWLTARLEEIDAAREITEAARPVPGRPRRVIPAGGPIPYYDLWLRRLRTRPMPANAARLMPQLRQAFMDEGIPPELAWLAEVESSFDPSARSPAGAKGLYQLMPDAAKALGLSTFMPDDRTDPRKAAHAAARQLRALRMKFGSWPLALAAYNAGEGRVSRTLKAKGARNFAGIAASLPAETRMYVPETCALIKVRTGIDPEKIAAPR